MGTIELLTPRERECLRLVAAHMQSKQIARRLGISPSTVDRHCEKAMRKLQAGDRVTAALMLTAEEGLPNDSEWDPSPIAQRPPIRLDDPAKGRRHEPDHKSQGYVPDHALGAAGSGHDRTGGYGGQTADGPASG
ncbi:hypothetical protein GCM10009422_25100 [Brevundimonas kwangchunensis]|uniref:HTH luxR-type domain-containing protein n=1 Tax=Brevundimonas kwangchunensis TaxID=322163 RepID=A0ABN1H2G9_9CAUL